MNAADGERRRGTARRPMSLAACRSSDYCVGSARAAGGRHHSTLRKVGRASYGSGSGHPSIGQLQPAYYEGRAQRSPQVKQREGASFQVKRGDDTLWIDWGRGAQHKAAGVAIGVPRPLQEQDITEVLSLPPGLQGRGGLLRLKSRLCDGAILVLYLPTGRGKGIRRLGGRLLEWASTAVDQVSRRSGRPSSATTSRCSSSRAALPLFRHGGRDGRRTTGRPVSALTLTSCAARRGTQPPGRRHRLPRGPHIAGHPERVLSRPLAGVHPGAGLYGGARLRWDGGAGPDGEGRVGLRPVGSRGADRGGQG